MEYRYRLGWFGKLILQVGVECQLYSSVFDLHGVNAMYWSDAKSEDLADVPLEKLSKFKIFRFRLGWFGKLILQVGHLCSDVHVSATHVWHDATIEELTAVGTDK